MSAAMTVFKGVTSLVVATGVGSIVTAACKTAVSQVVKSPKPIVRMANKVSVVVGAAVLSSMVADQAVKYADEKIDDFVDSTEEMKNNLAEVWKKSSADYQKVMDGEMTRAEYDAKCKADRKPVVQPDKKPTKGRKG